MNFTFEIEYEDFKVIAEIEDFHPSRSAPNCSNPDSPAYSDCGDDAEFDVKIMYFQFGNSEDPEIKKVPTDLADYLADIYSEQIIAKGEKLCEDASDDTELHRALERQESNSY